MLTDDDNNDNDAVIRIRWPVNLEKKLHASDQRPAGGALGIGHGWHTRQLEWCQLHWNTWIEVNRDLQSISK